MCPTSEQQLAKCTVELASLLGKSVIISYLRLESVITVLLNPRGERLQYVELMDV